MVSRVITLFAIFLLMYRYYDQDAFGYWATITASAAFLVCLATMRLELALVLPKYDFQARQLMVAIMLNSMIVVLLVLLLLLVYNDYILLYIKLNYAWLIYLVPVLLFTKTIQEASRLWLTRKKRFSTLAVIQVIGAVIMPCIAVLLAEVYSPQAWQLSLAAAISQFIIALVMLACAYHNGCLYGTEKLSAKSIKRQINKYRVYPFFMMPYTLSQGITQHVFVLLLGIYYTQAVVGAFSLAKRLFYAPVNMLVSPLRQVFYAHGRHDAGLLVSQQRVTKLLFMQALILPAGVVLLHQQGIEWVFSGIEDSFQETESFAHWLLLPAVTVALTGWLDRFYDLYGKQRLAVKLQILSDCFVFASVLTAMLVVEDALGVIKVFSVTLFLYDLFWLAVTLQMIGVTQHMITRFFVLFAVNAGLCWLLFSLFDQLWPSFAALTAKIIMLGCLVFVVFSGRWQKVLSRAPVWGYF